MYTGAPVPSARSATPPRWSKWPCVIRIAAHAEPLRAAEDLEDVGDVFRAGGLVDERGVPVDDHQIVHPVAEVSPGHVGALGGLGGLGGMGGGGMGYGGWMGGYGGYWVPVLLVIVVVGLVAWFIKQKGK